MQPHMYNHGMQMNMTPLASPRPMYQKPTILIQEQAPRLLIEPNAPENDMYYYPGTPPLSASGSSSSSPSSVESLHTPLNSNLYLLGGFEDLKEQCIGEMQPENLASNVWGRFGSPPMSPAFVHPNSLMSNACPSELLSAASCPSLSPSPSPYPHSVISEDFCDPRNLTVSNCQSPHSNSNPSLKPTAQFPALPTLCAGDDEEHRYMLGGDSFTKAAEANSTFDFIAPQHMHHGLPTFDQFSDLDSEDDFVNGLVNFPSTDNVQFFGAKRQRTGDLISIEHEAFTSEEDFDDFEQFNNTEEFAAACLPSPPSSGSESEVKKEKRSKKSKKAHFEDDSSEFDDLVRSRKYTVPMNAAAGTPPQEASTQAQENNTAPSQSGSSEANTGNNMGPGSDAGGTPGGAPVNRRGRKQSLTDDPSKTFICERCNRRFRRQEHLKRHYRSLHTEDKPFKCHECGKQFSRSDNLSQHSRTHGSGAILMGVLEDGEIAPDHEREHLRDLGEVLYNVAANASGSDSDATSDASRSDNQGRRKRKRSS